MWKYTEQNAFHSISLHDCRTDDIKIEGSDLIINFPEGFWITPASKHIQHDRPLKTGPAQLRFVGFEADTVLDTVSIYKTTYLFRKPVFCRRIQPEITDFLALINDGKHELEFLYEFHNCLSSVYQCWIWKKKCGMVAECQLELTAKVIEYCWNDICADREW